MFYYFMHYLETIQLHYFFLFSDIYFKHHRLPDGLTRRGDINMLMLGDPGTAKSQLLKFVENVSPIGVSNLFNNFI